MSTAEQIAEQAPAHADPYADRQSIEFRFRAKRFALIQRLIQTVLDEKGSARILDLGGTENYWLIGEDFVRRNAHRLEFTLVNNEAQPPVRQSGLFRSLEASATDRSLFGEEKFDLVHSNSVVEHVGRWRDMEDFAFNVRRLAPRYYVQTPNYWFPYEPHFRFPGFQFLPESVRARMITRFRLGFFQRLGSLDEARDIIAHHRLISTRQMRRLFPDAAISHEKVYGLNKSIIAVRDAD